MSDLFNADVARYVEMMRGDLTALFGYSTDKHLSKLPQSANFQLETQVRRGRIQLAMPYFGWYRVAIEGLGGIVPCCQLSQAGSALFAPTTTTTLPTDCTVYVVLHKSGECGCIIGVLPNIVVDGNYCFSDFVFQGSHVGFRDEYLSAYITLTADSGGVVDFSSNRPLDNLSTDWGVTTATGVGLHIDPALAFLRVSEACGVFCFYPDNTLRVTGRMLEVESDVHLESYLNDEGETSVYYAEALFPWEARGLPSRDSTPNREIPDEQVMLDREYGKLEPATDSVEPIFRYEEYGGYLGQGRIRQLSVPDEVGQSRPREATNEQATSTCVFREHIDASGAFSLISAKSLRLCRQAFPAQPRRRRSPISGEETADAVGNENYKASGLLHSGDDHVIGDTYTADGFTAIVGALDRLAYETNQRTLLGFHYHRGDFSLPEIEEPWQSPLNFNELVSAQGFSQGSGTLADRLIDERYEQRVKFARLLQMLEFTDDGGIILQGGHGEQISFVRGEIYIDCPSNVHIRPGKQAIVLAGDDAIIRAKNSVDITASQHDVRIKAERNQHLLSGNAGSGGFLVENRATGSAQDYTEAGGESISSSGIVFKAQSSLVSALAGNIYLRTGGDNSGLFSGKIVLDAGGGNADIVMTASTQHRFAKSSFVDSFGDSLEKITASNLFSRAGAKLNGRISILGSADITQQLRVRNGISITNGHVASRQSGPVGLTPLTADSALQAVEAAVADDLKTVATYYQGHKEQYYSSQTIGHAGTIRDISFGCRTTADYGTQSTRLPQAYWQQLSQGSSAVETWEEPAVEYRVSANKTYPWPGERWRQDCFMVMDPEKFLFYDLTAGKPKTRTYPANPVPAALDQKKPAEHYLVIKS